MIDRQNLMLRHEGGALCLRDGQGAVQRIPLGQMDRLVVENEALISANLIRQLAGNGIPLLVARGRSRSSAAILAPAGGDAARRLRQMRAWLDPDLRLHFARLVVRSRIAGQISALRAWANMVPVHRYPLSRTMRALRKLSQRQHARSGIATLRGMEGVASRMYFAAMRLLLPKALDFPGRRRRPPTDPVNASLSLGFTLLHGRILEVVHRAGLDPSIGALHELAYGRPSLVCDLVESERAQIERWVVRAFRQQTLQASHFSRTASGVILRKEGRGPFFATIEPLLCRCARRSARRVQQLIQNLPEL
ncbi:CRISPR-associated endonuclease Cas1 [Rehaibacterium terrae]|uniref:CRISPR-associated endonuclease Cas1 n=1 Tax=Rehaibacterium terrae TaxID=1341696 RepID=A0A7W7Y0N8_9GAMM|nr:CRISPR-associated protein Cas1 [Rehaibacterium terrae]